MSRYGPRLCASRPLSSLSLWVGLRCVIAVSTTTFVAQVQIHRYIALPEARRLLFYNHHSSFCRRKQLPRMPVEKPSK